MFTLEVSTSEGETKFRALLGLGLPFYCFMVLDCLHTRLETYICFKKCNIVYFKLNC